MVESVLIVEDDEVIADAVAETLDGAGFRALVAATGADALTLEAHEHPALVVLDLGLPDIDGLDLCRRLRASDPARPIIIVTARDEDMDVIVGLDAGACDYVTKPVSTAVLLARVRAQLRRAQADPRPIVRVGALVLDLDAHRVELAGRSVALRPREFALLSLLAREAGRVVTREAILGALWGAGWDAACNRALDVHVVSLRRKLGDHPGSPTWITTVRSIGYRFATP